LEKRAPWKYMPLNQAKDNGELTEVILFVREISSKSLVWLSKSWASACRFQIQVVVSGPLAIVLEKWPALEEQFNSRDIYSLERNLSEQIGLACFRRQWKANWLISREFLFEGSVFLPVMGNLLSPRISYCWRNLYPSFQIWLVNELISLRLVCSIH